MKPIADIIAWDFKYHYMISLYVYTDSMNIVRGMNHIKVDRDTTRAPDKESA
jgi:hypothetical protein